MSQACWQRGFGPVITEYLDDLRRQGLAESYIPGHPGPARHFLIWLRGSGIDVHTVDGNVVHRFLRHNCDCRPQDCMGHAFYAWRKRRSSPELMRFIRFLEQTGRIHTPGDLDDNLGLLDEFLGELQTAGYAQSTIDKHRYGCRNLIAWLHLSRISLNRIDANALETFLQRDFICSIPGVFYGREPGHNSRWYATTLRGFLRFLVDTGRIETMVPCVDAVDKGLGEFRSWLHRNRGIGEGRVEKLVKLISVVLPEIGDDPGQYDAALIRNVMLSRLENVSRGHAKEIASALRMYLRFLASDGCCAAALVDAVPTLPEWTLSVLPRYISADDVEHTIASCEETPAGRRDRAILLLLARLALRAGDVVNLRLTDVDWNNALLHVRGKARRDPALPLPQDAGDAIYDYIASPTSATRPDFQLISLDFDRSWSCKRLFSWTRAAVKRL